MDKRARVGGKVPAVGDTVDRAKATVMTKVRFDSLDPRILPEMSAKVAFLSQEISPGQQQPLVAVAAVAETVKPRAAINREIDVRGFIAECSECPTAAETDRAQAA